MLSSPEVQAIRSRFPLLRNKIYLNSCSQGALSNAVEDGLREYMASWHEHGSPWDIWVERYEAARSQFAGFIGATADEVAIGLDNVSSQIHELAGALLNGARQLGLCAKTPASSVGPLVVLQCRDAAGLVEKLAASGIVCSSRHDGLRLSFHVYNTLEDVRAVLQVLEQNLDLLVTDTANVSRD
jgi:selenocysteine lyase/cysteine desulfurase